MTAEELAEAQRETLLLMQDADIPLAAQRPVRALLDHVVQLEAENAALREMYQVLHDTASHETARLRAEVAALWESAIITVASDMASFMDTQTPQPAWSEEWVNWLCQTRLL